MKCPHCGNQSEEGAVYCIVCGTQLSETAIPSEESKTKLTHNKKLMAVITGIVAICVFVIVLSIILGTKGTNYELPHGVKWGYTVSQVKSCDPRAEEPNLNDSGTGYAKMYLSADGRYFNVTNEDADYGMTMYSYDESKRLEGITITFGGLTSSGMTKLLDAIAQKCGRTFDESRKTGTDGQYMVYDWNRSGVYISVTQSGDFVVVMFFSHPSE